MNEEALDELINADLDGVASAAQREALQRYLAADPVARGRVERMRAMTAQLETLGQMEPPAGLAQRIMARTGGRGSSVSPAHRVFEAPLFRYAAGVVIGVVLAAGAYEFSESGSGQFDMARIAGTMAHGVDTGTGPVVRHADFGIPDIGGSLQLRRSDDFLILTVSLRVDGEPVDLTVPLSADLRVVGFVGLSEPPPGFSLRGDTMDIRLAGNEDLEVLLTGSRPAVAYRLQRGGQLIFEDELPVPAGR